MAVGTDQGFAGDAEAFKVHLMADAVARARKIDTVFFAHGLYVAVVVGIFKAGLQRVVVNIRHRKLGAYPRHAHCFKFQICHRTGGILRERLIDFQRHLAARRHIAAHQMRADQFLCQCVSHANHSCSENRPAARIPLPQRDFL